MLNTNEENGAEGALQGVDTSRTSWAYEDIKLYVKAGSFRRYWEGAHNRVGCSWLYPMNIHEKLNILRNHCNKMRLQIDTKILAQIAKYNAELDASSYMAEREQIREYVTKTGMSFDMLGIGQEIVRDSLEDRIVRLLEPTYKRIDIWLIEQHHYHHEKLIDKLNIMRVYCKNKQHYIDSKIIAQMAKYIIQTDAPSYIGEKGLRFLLGASDWHITEMLEPLYKTIDKWLQDENQQPDKNKHRIC